MSRRIDESWIDEWNRGLADLGKGGSSSGRRPELIFIGGQPEGSWQPEIVLMWKTIDTLQGLDSDTKNEQIYKRTWISIHRSYLQCLNAERERLLAGVLKEVDLNIPDSTPDH